jgi:hypothetical protein
METYFFVRGTITIKLMKDRAEIQMTPSVGFLTPFEPYQAIAFPSPETPETTETPVTLVASIPMAMLIDLPDKKTFKCDASEIAAHMPALLTIAAQQKPLKLFLDDNLKVVGFTVPAP